MGIYDTQFFILEDPWVWDTRGPKFFALRGVYDIPVGDTRGYTGGARVTRPTLVLMPGQALIKLQ